MFPHFTVLALLPQPRKYRTHSRFKGSLVLQRPVPSNMLTEDEKPALGKNVSFERSFYVIDCSLLILRTFFPHPLTLCNNRPEDYCLLEKMLGYLTSRKKPSADTKVQRDNCSHIRFHFSSNSLETAAKITRTIPANRLCSNQFSPPAVPLPFPQTPAPHCQ